MNRKVGIYSISRIGEMILRRVDDEVVGKEGWEGSKRCLRQFIFQFHQNDKFEENNQKFNQ